MERIKATLEGKPVKVESLINSAYSTLDGSKAVLVERTPNEIISQITGKSLGKKEILIGEGVIKNGEIQILGVDGKTLHVEVYTVPSVQKPSFLKYNDKKVKQRKSKRGIYHNQQKAAKVSALCRMMDGRRVKQRAFGNGNMDNLILRVMG